MRHSIYMPRALLLAWLALGTTVAGCSDDDGAREDPSEQFPGGDTTNTLLLGVNAFTRDASNITDEHGLEFFAGNSFFNQAWVTAPASTQNRDGLGPLFNARSCSACHFKDGRGSPPLDEDENFVSMLVRLSVPGQGPHGAPVPDPDYGAQLQPFAILDVPAEARPRVTYATVEGSYADGERYELLEPTYQFDDPAYGDFSDDLLFSPRVAPQVIGLGLLEAIPESRLADLEDPDDTNNDGISGRRNIVWDVERGTTATGRFGWKAEEPTVRQQSAGAFLGDMGLTTPVFPDQACQPSQTACNEAQNGGTPEITPDIFDALVTYTQLLAVPVRRNYDNPAVKRGRTLFREMGCASCHTPGHRTGDHALPEVSDQQIWPYTDLLLHDMGTGLADGRPAFGASGREWRTPPLWGLGLVETINGHDRLLHDGRARGLGKPSAQPRQSTAPTSFASWNRSRGAPDALLYHRTLFRRTPFMRTTHPYTVATLLGLLCGSPGCSDTDSSGPREHAVLERAAEAVIVPAPG